MTAATCVVTGGASGMGLEFSRALVERGDHVVLVDRSDVSEVVDTLSGQGLSLEGRQFDVSDSEAWSELAASLQASRSPVRGLVNNAGIVRRHGIVDATDEDWQAVLDVNLTGPLKGIRALAPLMREGGGGSIVNISSIAGYVGHYSPSYTTTKWGLRGLTKAAALELAPWGVRVNSVHPGLVETPLLRENEGLKTAFTASTPLGRPAQPAEIVPTVLLLLSDASSYMTGSEVVVDGGFLAGGHYQRIESDLTS